MRFFRFVCLIIPPRFRIVLWMLICSVALGTHRRSVHRGRIPLIFNRFSERDPVWYASDVQNQMEHHDFEYRHQADEEAIKAFDSVPDPLPTASGRSNHRVDWEIQVKPMLQIKQTHGSPLQMSLSWAGQRSRPSAMVSITKKEGQR
jgi:hypothetical protein